LAALALSRAKAGGPHVNVRNTRPATAFACLVSESNRCVDRLIIEAIEKGSISWNKIQQKVLNHFIRVTEW
jgi:hypothetical protein